MNEVDIRNGLDVLNYLKESGVAVDETLCAIVPEEVAIQNGTSKVVCVIDTLADDVNGILASHFPDYYNTFPEATRAEDVVKLRRGFQRFVQQILFRQVPTEASHTGATRVESTPDLLYEEIDTLISNMRSEWLLWSLNEGYKNITEDLKELLPLLQQKYHNPMLRSEANMIYEEVVDVIPDEYLDFLYDMLIMLCSIYNIKIDHIHRDASLWGENGDFMDDIQYIASFLYFTLAWNIFDTRLRENKSSVSYLCRELLSGLNTFYFSFRQEEIMRKRKSEKPPETE